jgi:YD repeat-containing protein
MRSITRDNVVWRDDELIRVPKWFPVLSFVKYVDVDYSGKFLEMRWHSKPSEHFDLKQFDGQVETYLPCDGRVRCFEIGYRNAQGEKLLFERDSRRRLTQLTSPNKNWLRLSYGAGRSIADISDSRGRTVHYSYDERGQLTSVTYPSGEVLHYEYDSKQRLLTFSAAPDATTAPRVLLRNEYENGRIAKQTLADGGVYTYSYSPADSGPIRTAIVREPDGTTFDLDMRAPVDSIVRARDPGANSEDGWLLPE